MWIIFLTMSDFWIFLMTFQLHFPILKLDALEKKNTLNICNFCFQFFDLIFKIFILILYGGENSFAILKSYIKYYKIFAIFKYCRYLQIVVNFYFIYWLGQKITA